MILAGDIGGTKTVLALCDERGTPVREHVFQCAKFPSLEAILDVFLPEPQQLFGACFGVAGPVVDGTSKITNLPWVIDARALSKRLTAPVTLLNDLQATAMGMLALMPSSFTTLQQGEVTPGSTIGVIAPGTGLGESLLVSDGKRYRALPAEAGHADFAPTTDEEIELLRYLRGRYGPHVSVERVLCGNGIGDIYSFVRGTSGVPEPAWLSHELSAGDRNAVVAQTALSGADAQCVHALELFADLLGAEAGNLALRGLTTGGIVIGGGIPPKILPMLQNGRLIARFCEKGRFAPFMRSLAVRVALEPRAALIGAAHYVVTYKDAP